MGQFSINMFVFLYYCIHLFLYVLYFFRGAYTASKHAVAAWADSLRAELASSGVGITVISPGYVNTNLSRNALTSSGRNKKHISRAVS